MSNCKILGSDCKVYNDDCRNVFPIMENDSIDLIATDPPYGIDGMDENWSHKKLKSRTKDKSSQTSSIFGLPSTMKFDVRQGQKLQAFFNEISPEFYRILKPGAFLIASAQPRLYHRMVVALEDAGFEIRDMLIWEHNGGQGKAFKMDIRVMNSNSFSESEKLELIKSMDGRKTPQLRPKFEPIVVAQKPKSGTFFDNWKEYKVGLIKTLFDEHQQSTVLNYKKPNSRKLHDHMTIKPVELMERIVEIFSVEGQLVFDPFLGSGTTAVAALNKKRKIWGIEKDVETFKKLIGRILHEKR